jgi:hypothetical protein
MSCEWQFHDVFNIMSRHNVSRMWPECAWEAAGGNDVKGFARFNAEKSAEAACERR